LPLKDEQAIEIALFLILVGMAQGNEADAQSWLRQMAKFLALSVRTHGPILVYSPIIAILSRIRANAPMPTARGRRLVPFLIPLLASFLTALGERDALKKLVALKQNERAQTVPWKPENGAQLTLLRWKYFVREEDDGFVAVMKVSRSTLSVNPTMMCNGRQWLRPMRARARTCFGACFRYRTCLRRNAWM
jgi:hypothetical protein